MLSLAHNFAWITNGARSFINTATEGKRARASDGLAAVGTDGSIWIGGVGSIYVDATRVVVVTNKIEGHRLLNEEMIGLQSEITVRASASPPP